MAESVGGIYYSVTFETSQLVQGQRAIDRSLASAGSSVGSFGSRLDGLTTKLTRVAGAVASLAAAAYLISQSDAFTKLTAQLTLATDGADGLAQAQESVRRTAHDAQADISAIGTLYARISNATKELGLSQRGVGDIVRVVALSMKVSGASAQESASAMLQLSQSFASGVLRGEEFNAVSEAAPRLLKALADGMGVPIGQLRAMANAGKLTSDILATALPKALQGLEQEAKSVQTISGAFQQLKNQVMLFIGQQVQASGAGKALASTLDDLATKIGGLGDVTGTFLDVARDGAVVAAGVIGGRFLQSITESTQALLAGAAASRVAAAAEALRLKAIESTAYQQAGAAASARAAALAESEVAASALAAAKSEVQLAAAAAEAGGAQAALASAAQAEAAAQVEKVRAEIASLAATEEAIVAARAQKVEELQLMQAFKERGLQMAQIGAATTELAVLGQQQARVTSLQADAVQRLAAAEAAAAGLGTDRLAAAKVAETEATLALTAAENTLAATRAREAEAAAAATVATAALTNAKRAESVASTLAAGVTRTFGAVVGALGGPVGIAIVALGLLALNWDKIAGSAKSAAEISEDAAARIARAQSGTTEAPMRALMSVRDEAQAEIRRLDAEIDKAGANSNSDNIALAQGGFGGVDINAVDTSALEAQREAQRGAFLAAQKAIDDLKKRQLDAATQGDEKLTPSVNPQQLQKQATQRAAAQAYLDGLVADSKSAYEKIAAEETKALDENKARALKDAQDGVSNADIYERARVAIVAKYAHERALLEEQTTQQIAAAGIAMATDEAARIEATRAEGVRQANAEVALGVKTAQQGAIAVGVAEFNAAQARADLRERGARAAAQEEISITLDAQRQIEQIRDEDIRQAEVAHERKLISDKEYEAAKVKAAIDAVEQMKALDASRRQFTIGTLQTKASTSGGNDDQEKLIRAQAADAQAQAQAAYEQGIASAQEYADRRVAIEADMNQRIADLRANANATALQSTSTALGALTGALKNSGAEQSGIYKGLFAAQKAFAIASSIVAIQQGIANASALAWPANLAAIASVIAATANIVSTISGVNYGGGRQYGGPASAGSLYRVNETGQPEMFTASNGAQYMMPTQNGNVTPAGKVGGQGGWTINIYDAPPGTTASVNNEARVIEIAVARAKAEIGNELSSNSGPTWSALRGGSNIQPRL